MRNDYTQEALGDQITNLPGLSANLQSKYTMFAGYITVDEKNNRNIFYWFVESLNNPTRDPVAIWTNGGPGCSGLGGFFTEQGPFRVNGNLTLVENTDSWVNVANMIFIEAPAGVGFSYSDVESDYSTDDNKTAIDNYHFIQGWLKQFTNFQQNEFYITSESYGGHYMPTLAQQIIIGNNADGNPQVNFKGVFVGNPYTDPVENAIGTYDTWFGHQMVALPTWQKWYTTCQNGNSSGVECLEAEAAMNSEVGDVDPYALDYPICGTALFETEIDQFVKVVLRDALHRPIPKYYQKRFLEIDERRQKMKDSGNGQGGFPIADYDPCAQNHATRYLNEPNVQSAIYAKPTVWTDCSTKISYSVSSSRNPMEPTWKWLVAQNSGARFTVVSGDDDSVCGTTGTQSWMFNLGYEVGTQWQPWISDGQIAGYVTKFVTSDKRAALNLVTVHSAGHMIPQTQPARSLASFTNFLKGEI